MTAHANLPNLAAALSRELALVHRAYALGRDYAVDLAELDLSAATLAVSDLRRADFTGANLAGAGFEEAAGLGDGSIAGVNTGNTPAIPVSTGG